jgi:hypothetical protein
MSGEGRSIEREGKRSSSLGRIGKLVRAVVLAPVLLYQRLISPALPRRCRYEPTCSRYAVQAVGEYGILRGLALAIWRLLRCNPWSHGGYDPVGAQQLFKVHRSSGL